jgi:hypothetical protein
LTVKDGAGQLVAALVTTQMPADVAWMVLMIEECKHVQSLPSTAQLRQRTTQGWNVAATLKGAQQLNCTNRAHLEQARQPQQVVPGACEQLAVDAVTSQPQQVVPGACDQLAVDAVTSQAVQYARVGSAIQAPQPRIAHVGQAWAAPIPEQPECAKHLVGVGPTVGDDFGGRRPRPLFEQTRQQIGRVLGSAWHDDTALSSE